MYCAVYDEDIVSISDNRMTITDEIHIQFIPLSTTSTHQHEISWHELNIEKTKRRVSFHPDTIMSHSPTQTDSGYMTSITPIFLQCEENDGQLSECEIVFEEDSCDEIVFQQVKSTKHPTRSKNKKKKRQK